MTAVIPSSVWSTSRALTSTPSERWNFCFDENSFAGYKPFTSTLTNKVLLYLSRHGHQLEMHAPERSS